MTFQIESADQTPLDPHAKLQSAKETFELAVSLIAEAKHTGKNGMHPLHAEYRSLLKKARTEYDAAFAAVVEDHNMTIRKAVEQGIGGSGVRESGGVSVR